MDLWSTGLRRRVVQTKRRRSIDSASTSASASASATASATATASLPPPPQKKPTYLTAKRLLKCPTFVADTTGIDLSIRSPGAARYVKEEQTLHVWYLSHTHKKKRSTAKRKKRTIPDASIARESNLQYGMKLVLHPIVVPEPEEIKEVADIDIKARIETDAPRFATLAKALVDALDPPEYRSSSVRIEDYIYHAADSSSITGTAELCGLLKHFLYMNNPQRTIFRINVSTCKKQASGSSLADKWIMYREFDKWFPQWSRFLQQHFKWEFDSENHKQNVDNPLQDIIDAIGLITSS